MTQTPQGSVSAPSWRVEIELPSQHFLDLFEAALEPLGGVVTAWETAGGGWSLVVHADDAPSRGELATRLELVAAAANMAPPELRIEEVPPTDWVADYQKNTKPREIGRFYVYPSHAEGPIPENRIGIRMDAGLAFGTGEHGSTEGCLLALGNLFGKGAIVSRALDMGCGSGILAIAMARLWRALVLAADMDQKAVGLAAENANVNGLGQLIRSVDSDGYGSPVIDAAGPFDLITANILARSLEEMAPQLARHLAPGGTAILSGLLGEQEDDVLAAHQAQGLQPEGAVRLGEWTTLILRAG